jgi:hypothetical protein
MSLAKIKNLSPLFLGIPIFMPPMGKAHFRYAADETRRNTNQAIMGRSFMENYPKPFDFS